MRKKVLIALVAALAAGSALAAAAMAGLPTNTQSGSKTYVSDFSGGTCSPLESSKIAANTTIYAISTQNITLNETVYMQGTSSKNSTVVASGTFPSGSWQLCPGSTNLWWQVLGSLPNTGTYTMEVNYPSGKNFSSDSFQIVP